MLPHQVRSKFMANQNLKTQKNTMDTASQMKKNAMDLISKRKITILQLNRSRNLLRIRFKMKIKIMLLFFIISKKDTRSGLIKKL